MQIHTADSVTYITDTFTLATQKPKIWKSFRIVSIISQQHNNINVNHILQFYSSYLDANNSISSGKTYPTTMICILKETKYKSTTAKLKFKFKQVHIYKVPMLLGLYCVFQDLRIRVTRTHAWTSIQSRNFISRKDQFFFKNESYGRLFFIISLCFDLGDFSYWVFLECEKSHGFLPTFYSDDICLLPWEKNNSCNFISLPFMIRWVVGIIEKKDFSLYMMSRCWWIKRSMLLLLLYYHWLFIKL